MEPISNAEKVGVLHDDICDGCDDHEGGSIEKEKAMKAPVKILHEKNDLGGGIGGVAGGKGGCSGLGDGDCGGGVVGGGSPPPFLRKTFELVEDPQTNWLISWSDTGKSFVIWDHNKFSSDLLPKYFRHNNFSSFIYQLNSYGFKKINSDRWEYENEWFQAEKQHLLKNIKKRRTPQHSHYSMQHPKPKGVTTSCPHSESARHGSMEMELLEKLRTDQNILKMEISKLKQQLENMEEHMRIANTNTNTNTKQQKIFIFIANGEEVIIKKQRLVTPQSTKSCEESLFSTKNAAMVQDEELKTQRAVTPETTMERSVKTVVDSTNPPTMNSQNCILLEKLLEDDLECVNEAEEELAQRQSKVILELEDLIEKPPDWTAYVEDLMQQPSGLS